MKKDVPVKWDEKKKPVSVSLTPTAIKGLDELAKEFGETRSQLIEKIGRRILTVVSSESINSDTI